MGRAGRGRGPHPDRGAVLLEVLLALGLFVFAAVVISSGLSAAVDRAERLRAQTHALDLAATVLAEIQMGVRPAAAAGPEAFAEPFERWTWEILTAPYTFDTAEVAGLQVVTVVVRGEGPSTVQQLTEMMSVGSGPSERPLAVRPLGGVPGRGGDGP